MSLIAAGDAASRVALQARGASGVLGCATTTTSVVPSAGRAPRAARSAVSRPASSPAWAAAGAATAKATASTDARRDARTGSGRFLDEDTGRDALQPLPDLGRAAGRQLVDVALDLLQRVRRQHVEADTEIAPFGGAQVGDLAGQMNPLSVGQGHDDVDGRAHGGARAERQ